MNTDERAESVKSEEVIGYHKSKKIPVYDKQGDKKPLFRYKVDISDIDFSRIDEIKEFVMRYTLK